MNTNPATTYFIDALFGDQTGQLCLGYINGDPLIEDMRSEWYDWPRQRPLVLQRFAEHDAQGHDIYVRQALFSKRRAYAANALPSAWIWQDDVKETRAAYTLLIETSAGNHQALLQLDRPATTAERKCLMTAWRNNHDDADDCSADPVHFVRVPGGHNHKRHGCEPVRLVEQTGRIYPTDRLLAKYAAAGTGEGKHTPPAAGPTFDQAALDHWLTHVEQLLTSDKALPRAFVRDTPGRRILELRAAGKGMLFHTSGSWDASRERLWLANSLVLARYTNEQIAALLWHFELSATVEIKGKDAIWADIGRVIALARKAHPAITPRLYGGQGAPKRQPKVKRGRAGDHAALVEQVYSLLIEHKAGVQAVVKTGELASAIGCHRRTIITILGELQAAGRIGERRQLGRHGGLVIPILGVIYSSPAEADSPQPSAPNETPPTAALGETEIPGGCVSPESREADHSSPALPEPGPDGLYNADDFPPFPELKPDPDPFPWPRTDVPIDQSYPALVDLAAHYLDQRPADIGQQCVNKRTGQVTYRRTAQHFAGLVVAEYPYTHAEAFEAYAAERQRRKDTAAEEWRRFFTRLRDMTNDELISYIGGRCKTEIAEMARAGSTFDKHMYSVRLRCARQQLRWRGVTMPSRKTRVEQQAAEDAQRARGARQRLVRPEAPRLIACQPVRSATPAPVVDYAALAVGLADRLRVTNRHADHASEK